MDGTGARINGGRWNSVGVACIYTSQSRALAALEYAVNVSIDDLPPDLVMITLDVPDAFYTPRRLPQDWHSQVINEATRDFGSAILRKGEHLIIKLPSVVVPQENNFIINPRHKQMNKVSIVDISPFSLDARLKK